jgi:hypothetical protein
MLRPLRHRYRPIVAVVSDEVITRVESARVVATEQLRQGTQLPGRVLEQLIERMITKHALLQYSRDGFADFMTARSTALLRKQTSYYPA